MADLIFEFRKNGQPCGFHSAAGPDFVFKPDKYSATIMSLETLKTNLRRLVKAKQARIITVGTIEAVVVPERFHNDLFI